MAMRKKMRIKFLSLSVVIVALFGVFLFSLRAQTVSRQKEIAVTIDDLPLNGPSIEIKRLQAMTDKLLAGINKQQIPVVGFVNESLLYVPNETDERIAILKAWSDGGVELGNHTFSHTGFKNATLADYEDDFIRGDAITRMLMKQKGQKPRYFRHPFLQMGQSAELEKSFESFIAERGYRAVPVTIDTMDWMFLAAYSRARTQNDSEMSKRVSDEYLKFVALKIDSCEGVSNDLFGRAIKQILLLHANELNAENFDALVKVFKDKGYQFITVENALKDSAYQFPDKYKETSDWLSHWTFSKGKSYASPAPPDFIQRAYKGN